MLEAAQSPTTIYCPRVLREELWPSPLAEQWHHQYPGLFDGDDLRLISFTPPKKYHFYEWLAAIYLFHRDGSLSMVEKYQFPTHTLKFPRYTKFLSGLTDQQREVLTSIREVQLPDLLVEARDGTFSFAEVKGQGDDLSDEQIVSHELIRSELKVPVEIIKVEVIDLKPPGSVN